MSRIKKVNHKTYLFLLQLFLGFFYQLGISSVFFYFAYNSGAIIIQRSALIFNRYFLGYIIGKFITTIFLPIFYNYYFYTFKLVYTFLFS